MLVWSLGMLSLNASIMIALYGCRLGKSNKLDLMPMKADNTTLFCLRATLTSILIWMIFVICEDISWILMQTELAINIDTSAGIKSVVVYLIKLPCVNGPRCVYFSTSYQRLRMASFQFKFIIGGCPDAWKWSLMCWHPTVVVQVTMYKTGPTKFHE